MKKIHSIFFLLLATFIFVSCNNETDEIEQGYLKLELNTVVSTVTRTSVPPEYNARKLHVSIINSSNETVKESDWVNGTFANNDFKSALMLTPGTYTITAHSADWDGSDSGWDAPYYAGSTTITVKRGVLSTAKITCTQENVKVTVIWDESFPANFSEATATVSSANRGVATRAFYMDEGTKSAYFPVDALKFVLSAISKSGKENSMSKDFTDVKPRDHYIITYKVADYGKDNSIDVYVDPSTQTYNFTVNVNREPGVSLDAKRADAWATFANISCEVLSEDYDASKVTLQWKLKDANEWTDVANTDLTPSGNIYSYKLTGLAPKTAYTYRFTYNDGENEATSNEISFTTDVASPLYNGGFENWYSKKNVWYPNEEGVSFWDSSNPGSAGALGESGNVTTRNSDFKHSGTYSAKLASMFVNAVVITKFAAASMYTGKFIKLVGTSGAKLDWGVPFTARPSALKGYMSYSPGTINHGSQPSGVDAPASGTNDYCQIYCALLTEQLHVDNTDMSTFPAWDGSDDRVIAYGQLSQNTSDNNAWKEFKIPLTYYSTTEKPTHLLIVCSSSKFGDYFYGSDTSVLYIDDFEFEYGEPTLKQ